MKQETSAIESLFGCPISMIIYILFKISYFIYRGNEKLLEMKEKTSLIPMKEKQLPHIKL